jgi:hypothetical protein
VRQLFDQLAGERLLRQRRPVVRRVRFVAQDDDLVGVALRAQRLGRAQARHARADHDRPLRHAGSVLDRDRLDRADVGGLLDGVAQVLADLVLELDQLAVVVELEDLRRREDALPVVLADVAVDPHGQSTLDHFSSTRLG